MSIELVAFFGCVVFAIGLITGLGIASDGKVARAYMDREERR